MVDRRISGRNDLAVPGPEETRDLVELRDYLRIMRRRWLMIVSCVVVAVAVSAGVTFNMTPQYASSTGLFVSTTPSSSSEAYQGSLFSAQRITSYADLATGQELSRRVIDELDLDLTPAELAEKIDASVVPETVSMDVTVTDANPETAQVLSQTTAEQLALFVDELETPPGRANAPIKMSVVDAAPLPLNPVSPQPVRNLGLALVLGLLLGLGLAVLRELLDTSVKSPQDIESVTEAPMMAGFNFDSGAVQKPLITQIDSHAPRREAFRVLRTNLQFIDVDNTSKVFAVSSSIPGEGKTTTATNLAITLAQAGERVLMIDGDLRRPQVARVFDLEGVVGLTTVLIGTIEFEDAVQPSPVDNLDVLTSGAVPPNPSELLQSQAMHDLLERGKKEYDVIVIDTPPLLPVTDAALLAAQADGALVVVRHGKTTRDQLNHSMERLEAVDAKALGVVLNMIPSGRNSKRYGYGYGYGYGYAPEPGRKKRSSKRD
jgi:capsular exopolysaccharide synthesis family protein